MWRRGGEKETERRQIKKVDQTVKKLPIYSRLAESDMALEKKIPEFRNNNFSLKLFNLSITVDLQYYIDFKYTT